MSLSQAPARDRLNLQNWVAGTGSLDRDETAYLDHHGDLVSLASPGDNASDRLGCWIENALIWWYKGFRQVCLAKQKFIKKIFIKKNCGGVLGNRDVSTTPISLHQTQLFGEDIVFWRGKRRRKSAKQTTASTLQQCSGLGISSNPDVYIYSGKLIKRLTRVVLLIVAMLLLLVPVVLCNSVVSALPRLGIVVLSSAVFLFVLDALMRIRTFELVLAGTT